MAKTVWNEKAGELLKSKLSKRKITYGELAERLNAAGSNETYDSIASKISRGTFTLAFYLQCLEVIDVKKRGSKKGNNGNG